MAVRSQVVGERETAERPRQQPGEPKLAARGDEQGRDTSRCDGPAGAGKLGNDGFTTTKARALWPRSETTS